MIPGLPTMPPLNFMSNPSSGGTQGGNVFKIGDFNVNNSSKQKMYLVAGLVAVGVIVLILKK